MELVDLPDLVVATPAAGRGDRPSGGAARIFNSVVAGFAIATAWEVGALDLLAEHGVVDVAAFCARRDLHPASIGGMFAALAAVDVVHRDAGSVWPGPEFAEVHRDKAFFHWLTAGCGELFAAMPRLVRNENRRGEFYRRDPAAITHACREINRQAFDPTFWRVLEALDDDVTRVADLGCGSGARLAQMATRWPHVRGVGVDLSGTALSRAHEHLTDVGLAERFDLVADDVRAVAPDPRFAGVEVLTCFMMGHDLWPLEECRASLRRLRTAFPDARRLLLGDTARIDGVPDRDKPVFTVGFEAAHDLMGVHLPTLREWEGAFEGSGWTLVAAHTVSAPAESVVFELA